MNIPRYYFSGEFAELYEYFLSQPHTTKTFRKNEYLWGPGELLEKVYYIQSGIAQTVVEHENGFQKILHFHSSGTIYPGCHQTSFKIERSILTKALSDVETLVFSREDFYGMFKENSRLNSLCLEQYAAYINLLIYEAAHQEYNNSFIKLCNLLYLFSQNSYSQDACKIDLTQENIADILTINRVNAAKCLSRLRDEEIIISHRKWIEIRDLPALKGYCSMETLSE